VVERAFRRLEQQVPPPVKEPVKDSFWYRYAEQTIEQAILQKCARVASNLAAARLLLNNGFVYEQAMMHRALDEALHDVLFLAGSVANGQHEDRHDQYLKAFWAETFNDPDDLLADTKGPNMVLRKHINAYVARALGSDNPYRDQRITEAIDRVNSGFIHGSTPAIMELCVGSPPRFCLSGMFEVLPRMDTHAHEAWNYYYRALMTFGAAAKAFGDEELYNQICEYMLVFEEKAGRKVAFKPSKKAPKSKPDDHGGGPAA